MFRLRCKTTDVEMNMKGLYEEYKCKACGLEDERQEHVTNCDILLKMNDEGEIVEYKKLRDVQQEREVAIFKQVFIKQHKASFNLDRGAEIRTQPLDRGVQKY